MLIFKNGLRYEVPAEEIQALKEKYPRQFSEGVFIVKFDKSRLRPVEGETSEQKSLGKDNYLPPVTGESLRYKSTDENGRTDEYVLLDKAPPYNPAVQQYNISYPGYVVIREGLKLRVPDAINLIWALDKFSGRLKTSQRPTRNQRALLFYFEDAILEAETTIDKEAAVAEAILSARAMSKTALRKAYSEIFGSPAGQSLTDVQIQSAVISSLRSPTRADKALKVFNTGATEASTLVRRALASNVLVASKDDKATEIIYNGKPETLAAIPAHDVDALVRYVTKSPGVLKRLKSAMNDVVEEEA